MSTILTINKDENLQNETLAPRNLYRSLYSITQKYPHVFIVANDT